MFILFSNQLRVDAFGEWQQSGLLRAVLAGQC